MRIVVYGAGAVGGVIGGRLAQHGHDVVLIARGAHLEAIRANGLRIDSPDDCVTVPVPGVGSPAEIAWRAGDAVVLAMKTQDTEPALEALVGSAPARTPIVCAQNGVENERLASRRFRNVYGTSVMLPATHMEPGVVEANSSPVSGILDTGCYPSGVDSFCGEFTAALRASTFSSEPDPVIMRKKHRKLIMNLTNAFQAALGDRESATDMIKAARAEAEACFDAAGIDYASESEDRERRGTIMQLRPIQGRRRGGGSTWQSLARGTGRLEADWLNGEIVLLGKLHGVPTPVNATIQRVANRLAREGKPPGSITVAELQGELAAERE